MNQTLEEKIQILNQKAEEDLKEVTEENEKLKDFIVMQQELISKQQSILQKISENSKKLIEIENSRQLSLTEITKFKNLLKNLDGRETDFSQLVETTLEVESMKEPEKIQTDDHIQRLIMVSKAIETIQTLLYSTTEKCMKESRPFVTKEEMQCIILSANKIIEMAIESGVGSETIEEAISRQQRVLHALDPNVQDQ